MTEYTVIMIEVEHYPFKLFESEKVVKGAYNHQLDQLVRVLPLTPIRRNRVFKFLESHFLLAESHFSFEEQCRMRGFKNADLFYHRKEHAVYQAGYDSVTILRSLLSRGDNLSNHLSLEGIVAGVLAAPNHDTGYVVVDKVPQSYASLTPIHVEKSMQVVKDAIEKLPPPEFLDADKIASIAAIAIHSTHFPFDKSRASEMRHLIDHLTQEERKEAHIIRLGVQLADLGGQVARIDYVDLLKDLKEEINRAQPGVGTTIIGEDHEMASKCRGFIDYCVRNGQVGKTANAFFGTRDHTFAREWEKHGVVDQSLITA